MSHTGIYGLIDQRTLQIRYVGQGLDIARRISKHRSACSTGYMTNRQAKLYAWLRELKTNELSWTLLEEVKEPRKFQNTCWWWSGTNVTALNNAERWWVAFGRACGWDLCNANDGGGANWGWSPSVAVKEKIRCAVTEHHKTQPTSQITRNKLAQASRGRVKTEATRSLLSAANKGKVLSESTKALISAANKGKVLSESTKVLMRAAAQKGPNSCHAKLTLNQIYELRRLYRDTKLTADEIAIHFRVSRLTVHRWASGYRTGRSTFGMGLTPIRRKSGPKQP